MQERRSDDLAFSVEKPSPRLGIRAATHRVGSRSELHPDQQDPRALRRRPRQLRPRRRRGRTSPARSCSLSRNEAAKPLYVELTRAVVRAGGHVIGQYSPDDDASYNVARFLRARERRADRLLPGALPSRPRRRDRSHGRRAQRRRHARARGRSAGEDHAPRRVDEAVDGVAHREGERRQVHVDARPLRNAGDGRRGGHERSRVLAADHRRLLPRRARPDRPLARGQRADQRLQGPAERARHRARARPRARTSICGSRSARAASGSAAAAATFRASRSSRAPIGAGPRAGSTSTSRSTATATSSRASGSSSRRAVVNAPPRSRRGADQGDGRDRERRQGGGVLADRQPLLADHEVHGRDALRRERRRSLRQHPHRARQVLPRLLRRRPERRHAKEGSASASTTRASTPTSSRRPTARSPRRCATAARSSSTRAASFSSRTTAGSRLTAGFPRSATVGTGRRVRWRRLAWATWRRMRRSPLGRPRRACHAACSAHAAGAGAAAWRKALAQVRPDDPGDPLDRVDAVALVRVFVRHDGDQIEAVDFREPCRCC
jgi:hypothetical protein